MRAVLSDIVKHTGGLGFIDVLKVTGTKKETVVETMDADKTVVIKGTLKRPMTEFEGEFGMGRLSYLNGLCNHTNFKTDDAKVTVIRTDRGGNDWPSDIVFTDAQNQSWTYRLMHPELVPEQHKFIAKDWDVEFTPKNSKIQEFASFANLVTSFESFFTVKTVGDELRFWIGDENAASDKGFLIFEKPVKGTIEQGLHWPIAQVLSIMKLGTENNMQMAIMQRGALQITIDSKQAEWKYILPARRR